jgi:hypothetical protein
MAWPTQQHIFYRAADGSIQHIFWDAPTNRLFTDDWTGRAHAPAAVGHPMTMVWPNQQHLFYRARDGSVHHIFWDAPTNQLFTDNWSGNTGAPAADGNPDTLKIFATN